MSTVLVALGSFVGFIVAYHTYGRWLARRIFRLDKDAATPSHQMRDNVDFVPTQREVVFGHHFTSIAGTGPIVGPAIAVFWGWLPALLWVVFGSIFIGAVHDFGALVVSLRNRGQSVGQIAGRLISPRARVLFLLILALALTIVLAIFGLVIAKIFSFYPESVFSVWIELPIAVAVGYWVYRRKGKLLAPSLIALGLLYAAIAVGVYYLPIDLTSWFGIAADGRDGHYVNTVVIWTLLLLVYCFAASVLPVWVLLQPRDFINSHQLMVALVVLVTGMVVASIWGGPAESGQPARRADLAKSAPMWVASASLPADAPPMMPFLFITIACGAVSGFHCLVSSGTSSKQVDCETDAQYVGYGAMLLEGALAVLVILACCAGMGMGYYEKNDAGQYVIAQQDGAALVGQEAWRRMYPNVSDGWSTHGLDKTVGAFILGGANFMHSLYIPLGLAVGVMAVLVASFAATTLDTATRLQRYVVQELAHTLHIRPLQDKYVATGFALLIAAAVALWAGGKPGMGGQILWPLFGATNQLLAGLALMVTAFYLWRRNLPIWFIVGPMLLMLVLPAWAMSYNVFYVWLPAENWILVTFGTAILALQAWMVVEGILVAQRARGVLEEALPPLRSRAT